MVAVSAMTAATTEDGPLYADPCSCGESGCDADWCEEDGPSDLPGVISRAAP